MSRDVMANLVARMELESAQFQREIARVQARTVAFTKAANDAAGSGTRWQRVMDQSRASASAFGSQLGPVAGQVNGFGAAMALATSPAGALAAGVAAVGAALAASVIHGEAWNREMMRTEALLRATGNASGFTAGQLRAQAQEVALNTLASVQGVQRAQQILLTFKSVNGEVFNDAIRLAQDTAAVFGGDITSAATQLGKALESPKEGMSALKEKGVTFNAEQRRVIANLQETGRVAEAQAEMLKVLREQVGGAGSAEAGGLDGAFDTLNQRFEEFFVRANDATGAGDTFTYAINRMARGVDRFNKAMFEVRLTDIAGSDKAAAAAQSERLEKLWDEYGKLSERISSDKRLTGGARAQLQARQREIKDEIDAWNERLKAEGEAYRKGQEQQARIRQDALDERAREEAAAADKRAKTEAEAQQRRAKSDAERAAAEYQRRLSDARGYMTELDRLDDTRAEQIEAWRADELAKLNAFLAEKAITEQQHADGLVSIDKEAARRRSELAQKEREEWRKLANERTEDVRRQVEDQYAATQDSWDRYVQSMRETAENTDQMWMDTLSRFSEGVSSAVTNAIYDWQGFGDFSMSIIDALGRQMVQTLVEIGTQRLVLWALEQTINTSARAGYVAQVSGEAMSAAILSGIHAYSSTAAIPITGPAMAPAAAEAALNYTIPAAGAAAAAAASSMAGIAHGGLDYVPKESTYLLDKGERVLSPRQNRDLDEFMAQGQQAQAQPVSINFQISAIDSTDMDRALMNRRDTIYAAVRKALADQGRRF